jgi:RNA polymerase sigma factor (sigma-70 family)
MERRLDASRPAWIRGWLRKTTRSVARDLRALCRREHEILAPPGALDRVGGTDDPEGRMAEGMDVHDIVDLILDELPQEQREVFVMHDLEDTPMEEVATELDIPVPTAYYRLNAARAVFAREWKARQESGTVPASLAVLTVAELIAAEHVLSDVPPAYTDELLRRLGEQLGEDFLGQAGGVVAAGAGTAAAAAKAGGITLTVWQVGMGVLLAGLAGAGLMAALRPAGAMSPPPAVVVLQDPPSLPAPEPSPTLDPAPAPPGGTGDARPSAPLPSEVQTRLLSSARQLLDGHDPARALSLLGRVTAPDLAEERDDLRRFALARLRDAGP